MYYKPRFSFEKHLDEASIFFRRELRAAEMMAAREGLYEPQNSVDFDGRRNYLLDEANE